MMMSDNNPGYSNGNINNSPNEVNKKYTHLHDGFLEGYFGNKNKKPEERFRCYLVCMLKYNLFIF